MKRNQMNENLKIPSDGSEMRELRGAFMDAKCAKCGGCGFTEDFETMSLSGVCGWCNGTGKQPRLIAQCKCPRAIREHGQDGCTEPDYIIHRGCPECGMPWSKFLPQNS